MGEVSATVLETKGASEVRGVVLQHLWGPLTDRYPPSPPLTGIPIREASHLHTEAPMQVPHLTALLLSRLCMHLKRSHAHIHPS